MKKVLIALTLLFAMSAFLFAQDTKQDAKKESSKSAKEYIADLNSNDENTIIRAADWLGREKESDALPCLKKLLKEDNRAKVRLHSAMAMGYIGDKSAVDSLNDRLLIEPEADVRYTIILSLTRIGISEEKHVDVLKKARDAETDIIIRDYMDKMVAKYKK